jgi:hypothetical protein
MAPFQGSDSFGVRLCTPTCDWNLQNCRNGLNCVSLTPNGVTDCIASGPAQAESPCQRQIDCSQGTWCFASMTSLFANCRYICDPTAATPYCPRTYTCTPVPNQPNNFGVCIP